MNGHYWRTYNVVDLKLIGFLYLARWLIPLFRKGNSKELEYSDLYVPPKTDQPGYVFAILEKYDLSSHCVLSEQLEQRLLIFNYEHYLKGIG